MSYKANFAPTIYTARELIKLQNILVNCTITNKVSKLIKPKQPLRLAPSKIKNRFIYMKNLLHKQSYINTLVNYRSLTVLLLHTIENNNFHKNERINASVFN